MSPAPNRRSSRPPSRLNNAMIAVMFVGLAVFCLACLGTLL